MVKAAKKASKKKDAAKKASKKKASTQPTGYIAFCQQSRPQLRAENEDWSMKQVTKELEKMWKGMDEEEQAQYE